MIINIARGSSFNCDPRTSLHIAELDTEKVRVKRDTIAIIDTKHPEHHYWVRYSNWCRIEDRDTKNLLLYMKFSLSENCTVRKGYDYSLYQYEIEFPE